MISTTEKKKKKGLILSQILDARLLAHFGVYTGCPITKSCRCSVKWEDGLLGLKGWAHFPCNPITRVHLGETE